MKTVELHHRTGEALDGPNVLSEVLTLLTVFQALRVPYWPNKSEKQKNIDLLQTVLNLFIAQELADLGWTAELPVTGDKGGEGLRVDFAKWVDGKLILIEVQFGNVGRSFADVTKFSHVHMQGKLALAISVCLTKKTADTTDSGLITYETLGKRIKDLGETVLNFPYLIIGLDREGSIGLDFSLSQFPSSRIFSGQGAKKRIAYAVQMLRAGADIGDVGGLPPAPPAKKRRLQKKSLKPASVTPLKAVVRDNTDCALLSLALAA